MLAQLILLAGGTDKQLSWEDKHQPWNPDLYLSPLIFVLPASSMQILGISKVSRWETCTFLSEIIQEF